ncbi:MAG: PilZ domain-containing protein, partial [Gammaproteobacteria bacterium]|nr:PilZ domain-containing protein [Gammaproteobacteria bacterium]
MEHRWGERVPVRETVELACGSSQPVAGLLENVSSSGAFVRTEGPRPARGPVEVILQDGLCGRRQSVRLPAYVVRETAIGVGIEWCEFAPRVIRELISRDRRAGAVGARARAQRSACQSPPGPNTATQPRAQSAAEPAAIGTNTLPLAGSAATEWACGPVGQ